MSSSSVSGTPERPNLTLLEIADRLELMAQALKALSDPIVKQHIIHEMRTLLAEAEQKL
jgi:hypothetical protein